MAPQRAAALLGRGPTGGTSCGTETVGWIWGLQNALGLGWLVG